MSKRDSTWPAVMRGVAGGALLGGGIGIGAYSSAVWLFLAVILMVAGAGLLGSAASVRRTRPDGAPVTVVVSALDRTVAVRQDVQPTIVTGTVLPQGDAPYRAQFLADLGVSDADRLLDRGRAGLPASVVPGPEAKPVFGFSGRLPLRAAVCVVTAVAVMWGVAVAPGEAWRFGGPTSSGLFGSPADEAADDPAEVAGSYAERFTEVIEYLREKHPGEVGRVTRINVSDTQIRANTYLGNGRTASYFRNTGQGWIESPGTGTAQQLSEKSFALSDLDRFDPRAFIEKASAQVPEALRPMFNGLTAEVVELKVGDDDDKGPTLLVEATFDAESGHDVIVQARADGTVAPGWRPADMTRSLAQLRDLVVAQKASPSAPVLTEVGITGADSESGPVSPASYPGVGAMINGYYRFAQIGRFSRIRADEKPFVRTGQKRFAFADLDAAVLGRVLGDAERRFGVEPVDVERFRMKIGTQTSSRDPFFGRLVLTVRYSNTGKAEVYDLKGAYLGRGEFLS